MAIVPFHSVFVVLRKAAFRDASRLHRSFRPGAFGCLLALCLFFVPPLPGLEAKTAPATPKTAPALTAPPASRPSPEAATLPAEPAAAPDVVSPVTPDNAPAPDAVFDSAAPITPDGTATAPAPAADGANGSHSVAAPESAQAQAAPEAPEPARLESALFRLPKDDPAGKIMAVLTLVSAPGWHAYAAGSSATGQAAQADLRLDDKTVMALFPPGVPKPDPFEPGKTALVYEGATPVFIPLPGQGGAGAALTGRIRAFSCSDSSCWPSSLPVNLSLDIKDITTLPPAEKAPWWPVFTALRSAALTAPQATCPDKTAKVAAAAGTDAKSTAQAADSLPELTPRSFTPALEVSSLLKAALLALAAGLILNFMPCVLPVVSLKLSGLLALSVEEGRHSRRRVLREHNFFFALGIVVYFLGLSLVLGAFGLAWGEMFQSPALAIVVTAVLFALSLSLFGVFHLPVVDLKIASGSRGHTRRGAFLTGMLTTLLATPCSGPFLGGVLAWTLLQPLPVIMTVFAAIGIGMASPYAVLAVWPRLVRLLPRPGAWMQTLEKGMAFMLAATCLYFLALLPSQRLLPTLAALWATALGAVIFGRGAHLSHSRARRLATGLLALAVTGAGLAFALRYSPAQEAEWVAYTPEAFAKRLGQDNLVLDFTADWCPTCKVLERTVLTPPRLTLWGERHKAVFMRVDLTRQTPAAMALLRALGSQSIPVAAFFPTGDASSSPLVLRDLYTASQFEQALAEAFEQNKEAPEKSLAAR